MADSPSSRDVLARYEWAQTIGREAAQLTLQYFQRADLTVERKQDASPVTVADREAEALLRRRIGERFADDAILGEEHGEQAGSSGFRWILDPIDGTKSFIHGVPLYGTMIGVEHSGRSHIGVVEIPGLNERVYAASGQGAWHQRGDMPAEPARVAPPKPLSESLFLTSQVNSFAKRDALDAYLRLDTASRLSRTWGDCYGYLLVAVGRAELMVDPAMSIWDAAALQPILEEAGGQFTDWQGRASIYGNEGVATNSPELLREVLPLLTGPRPG